MLGCGWDSWEEAAPAPAASVSLRDPCARAEFPLEDPELRLGPTVDLALCACGQGSYLPQVLAGMFKEEGLLWEGPGRLPPQSQTLCR